jgi:opacity protein-like surface antigen
MLFVASGATALDIGTIETGGALDLHLSPEPWSLGANMYLVYYMMPMLGVGPYWSLHKQGEVGSVSFPTLYSLGALGKLYLPMAYMEGKLTPYVAAGLGITSLEIYDIAKSEYTSETKSEFTARVGFDYWLTDKWTVWCAYYGDKVFADGYDFGSSIKVGVATFLMR